MLSRMLPEIDTGNCRADRFDHGLFERSRLSHHCDHHPVMVRICLVIEKFDPVFAAKRVHDPVHFFRITTFAEIRHALNCFFLFRHWYPPVIQDTLDKFLVQRSQRKVFIPDP